MGKNRLEDERRPNRSSLARFGLITSALVIALLMIMLPILAIDASACPSKDRVVGLGTLGGFGSYGNDINERGQVVGASFTAENPYANWHAFSWTMKKGMVDINPANSIYSQAKAVNDRGDIVGYYLPENGAFDQACLWTANGRFVDLGSLWGGSNTIAYARDINNNGMIVGNAFTYEDIMAPTYYVGHAVIWIKCGHGFVCKDIGTLKGGDMAWAYGVNDLNEVVGMSAIRPDPDGPMEYHAFVWTARGGMVDLGDLDTQSDQEMCLAYNINDHGQIVGHYLLPNYYGEPKINDYGFKCTDNARGLTAIVTPDGYASSYVQGINERGIMVGGLWLSQYDCQHAMLLRAHRSYVDLGTLPNGWDSWAMNINDDGIVVGTSSGDTDYGWGYQATIWIT